MALKTSRIEALSDGIFSISMTILIITFEILLYPQKGISESGLITTLAELWPDFLHYVVGFVILGAFWMEHHYQFNYIHSVDPALLFINIVALMFISLIPFSTCVAGDYGHTRTAAWLLEINLMAAGLVFYFQWMYAAAGHRFVPQTLSRGVITFHSRRNLIVPLVSIAALAVSFFHPRMGTTLYLAVPFIMIFYKITTGRIRAGA